MSIKKISLTPRGNCAQKEFPKSASYKGNVDLQHIYIDGTKIKANADKYSRVWKKSSMKHRQNDFKKITVLLEEINRGIALRAEKLKRKNQSVLNKVRELV